MIGWLRAWLAAHPAVLVFALTHASALFVGGLIVHLRRPPQPAVQLQQDTAEKKSGEKNVVKHDQKGAEDVVRRTFRLPPAGCPAGTPPVLASETTTHRAPSSIDTNTKARSDEQFAQHTDLRITPAPRPRWALGAGLEDPFGSRKLRLEAGMRLIGPVWLRTGLTPARGLPTWSVGAEVQF